MSASAVHFGDTGRELFGLYHPAKGDAGRSRGVVLCNPFGQEEIRAHRIFRVLAENLARRGHHVLRFDYFGTGDAAGSGGEATLSQWQLDVLAAHNELTDMSSARRVAWIGLRLGASLAVLAATEKPAGLSGLVLWDPVVSGRDYLAELARAHAAYLKEPLENAASGLPPATHQGVREALGYEIGAALEEDLKALDLRSISQRPARRILIAGELADGPVAELATNLTALGSDVVCLAADNASDWNSDDAMNAFVVPSKTVGEIVSTVEAWR